MASIRDQIMGKLQTALTSGTPPAGLTVHRYRLRPIEQDTLPAIVIYPVTEMVEQLFKDSRSPLVKRTLTVTFEVRATNAGGDSDETATPTDRNVDPLLNWVTSAIQGSNRLDGLSLNLSEREIQWDALEAGDGAFIAAKFTWDIQYQTRTENQEARS